VESKMVKGWPPKDNKARGPGPARNYKPAGVKENGGLEWDSPRPKSGEMPRGTPASESALFPMRKNFLPEKAPFEK